MANITNRAEIMNKIKALLAKTTANGASEAEAQNALAMAHRLMALHAIEAADVAVVDTDDIGALYGEFVAVQGKSLPFHILALIPVIEASFAVKVLVKDEVVTDRTTGRVRKVAAKLCLFGDVHSTVAANWAVNYLAPIYHDLWTRYRIAHTADRTAREPFLIGLTDGMLKRIQDAQRSVQLELPRARGAIVLVKERLDQAFDKANPELVRIEKPIDRNGAYAAGCVQGKALTLARAIGETDTLKLTP